MGRDARPYIPPARRRLTAVDFAPPEAVAAERRRLEAEREQRETIRVVREPEAEREEEGELDEPGLLVLSDQSHASTFTMLDDRSLRR